MIPAIYTIEFNYNTHPLPTSRLALSLWVAWAFQVSTNVKEGENKMGLTNYWPLYKNIQSDLQQKINSKTKIMSKIVPVLKRVV